MVRYRPGFARPEDALQAGDELLRVGPLDARGRSAFAVLAHSLAAGGATGSFPVVYRRGAETREAHVPLVRDEAPWRTSTGAFGFTAIAVLLLWRAPRSRAAQRFLPAALVWSLCWIEFQGGPPAQTYAYLWVRAVGGEPLGAAHAASRCASCPIAGRRARRRAGPGSSRSLGPTWTSMWFGWPLPIEVGTRLNPALGGLAIAALLAVLTQSYRRADTAGRRQLEWVMLGGYLGGLPVLLGVAAAALDPERVWLWNWSLTALVLIPLSFFVAITRSNLLDIDRVISTTATLSLLGMLLVGGALTALPPLVTLASSGLGLERGTVQLAFAGHPRAARRLRRAAPAPAPRELPLRRAAGAEARRGRARRASSPGRRTPRASSRSRARGSRRCCGPRAAWCTGGRGASTRRCTSAARRSRRPSRRRARSSRRWAAAARSRWRRRRARSAIPPTAARSEAWVRRCSCRSRGAPSSPASSRSGRKASGDVYTATDRALLSAIGSALASSLARIGETELAREARAREERLARYVPAAFASELARGAPEPGEREVSVLFADLRAYSRSAQGRAPEEVFAALSRYTQIVTGPVVGHGGTVVEFAGDGIMAVFGAPEPLPAKERAAVLAALEITAGMRGVDLFPGAARDAAPPIGVGIATGLAYVGTIHSFDRDIWSAIGTTTNLASRLQSLTRDLDAWIAIDSTTHSRASIPTPFTHHPSIPIRGFPTPQAVWTL